VTIEIRPLGTDDQAWTRLNAIDAAAFGGDPQEPSPGNDHEVMEFDRAVLAHDAGATVGCASAFSLDLSVPGGSVPTAGVTWVGVHPAHRRRGVMNALMRTLHDAVHERGREPLLALWASQGSLYQRFGYGVSSHSFQVSVPHHLQLAHAPDTTTVGLGVDLVPAADDETATRAVFDTARRDRPGMPALNDPWYQRAVADPESERGGGSSLRTFVVSDPSGPLAYARFRYHHEWSEGFGDGRVDVREMVSVSADATAVLYRTLLGSDLMTRTRLWNLPVDDPILSWLSDPKQLQLRRRDQLYIRLGEVGDALARRCYTSDIDLVLDVRDAFHPWNAGRWRLSGGPSGATCERTVDAADLSVDVGVLGATYLGGTSWGTLAQAGYVEESSPGAIARAQAAFGWPTAPWCPFVF